MKSRTLQSLFDAMHHGKYHFDEFLHLDVSANFDKVGWSNRIIYRPSKTLKTFQAFLNNVIFDLLPVNERVSFAYRKGVSVHQAVRVHASSRAFYQTDFSRFFSGLNVDLVRRTILSVATPAADVQEHLDRILELTTLDGGLPIGFVTSPSISNACLKNFDDALEAECEKRSILYSRYADDIIVSASNRSDLAGIAELIEKLSHACIDPALETCRSKSRLTTIGRRVRILGLEILPSGRVTISREIKEKVEYLIHFLISDKSKFEAVNGGDGEKGLMQLQGFIGHIHASDPLYLAKLRKKFGATVVDSLLHRSLQYESN